MRIAMVSTPFVAVPPKTYGGTELVVSELVEGLQEAGHEVILFATGDSRTAAALRSIYPTAQWPPEMLTDLNHISWAYREACAMGADLIHAHSAVALAAGRLSPDIPLVYTLHHERDENLSAFYRYFRHAKYIAISRDQASREIRLPEVTVIHHGLDPSPYEYRETPEDYVCFMGRFAEVKGPHTAMDVAEQAGVRIRVAGETHPVDREFGEREIRPRLTRPHVSYVGCVGLSEKVPLLRGARALLSPIGWNEPFGLVFIEAMLSGCPVVAFPRGSVPEIVEEGVTGFVAQSADEMAEIIRPGGRLEGFDRLRCRERAVERFSRERMVREHVALYERILRAGVAELRQDRSGARAERR